MERYQDKVVLITGAGDVAEAAAKRLLCEGAKVAFSDFSQEALDAAISGLKAEGWDGERLMGIKCDVRKYEGGDVAHVDVALPRAGGPLQGGVHRVQAAQEGVHLLKIEQAVFAQFQVASLSEKEGDSQLPFQAGDGGAEGGLGDHQLFRGPVEVQLSGCCPKIIELIQCQIAAPPKNAEKYPIYFPIFY